MPTAEGLIRFRELQNQEQVYHHSDFQTSQHYDSLHSFRFSSTRHGTLPGHSPGTMKPLLVPKPRTVGSPVPNTHLRNLTQPYLHNRLKQQYQAILTTYEDYRIILINSLAQEILVSHVHQDHQQQQQQQLVGKSVMDLIDPAYQNRLRSIIVKRRTEYIHAQHGMVLVCGNVIPIVKLDGTTSSCSLWLKEKLNESGSSVFIWIFEQVYETSISLSITKEGMIRSILNEESVTDLYEYNAKELLGKPLTLLVPQLNRASDMERVGFFGSTTKRGAQFPIIIRPEEKRGGGGGGRLLVENTVRITSIPVIAGLMTVNEKGIIEGCNDIFVKYLFGFSQQELLETHISLLLPQFTTLLANLKRDDLLQPGFIMNHSICRKLLSDHSEENKESLPVIVAMHRDGTLFEVQLQLKWVDSNEIALWISFDREMVFKRSGHPLLLSPSSLLLPPPSPPPPLLLSPPVEKEPLHKKKAESEPEILYSAQTNKTTIEDYTILSNLGQGAFGLVKLAVKKNDPSLKKVVIKYVIKSRILVDCWTRDRKLGTVPVEIHILHSLRKTPHENLCDMLDYFEDADHYYIVMGLHGNTSMDLFDYIELNDQMEESTIQGMFKQIAMGVRHLHDHKIVHRDIKDENVVLDQNTGGLRLIDFGSAAYLKPGRKFETFVGTLDYAAPEILRGHTYSGKPQDVWALGILLFTLVYRENPFYDIDEIMGRELRIPFVLSQGSVDLISKMLERDVDKRIDIHQVLAHPWLNC
ncbi:kinase-like domain-containing protein [Pilaira anomala]|nr:kinase-like domain-containing protein [Pilaira anomala]